MKLLLVCTTVDDEAVARRMADSVIREKLAACVHIDAIESCYEWQGQVEQAREWRLSCKTTAARAEALQAAIMATHPYEVPAVYVVPILEASPAYTDWVLQQTRGEGRPA